MFKMFAVLEGLFGICLIIVVLWLAYKGFSTWLIIFVLIGSIYAGSSALLVLRPKNKKLNTALVAIMGACLIIMGLLQGVWGSGNTTVMALFALGGICELVSATLVFFNIGYRHHVTYK